MKTYVLTIENSNYQFIVEATIFLIFFYNYSNNGTAIN